jgi:CheY-like chemotaxis protein
MRKLLQGADVVLPGVCNLNSNSGEHMRNKIFTLDAAKPKRQAPSTLIRILVAEDFLFNREIMKLQFEQIGRAATFASNGKQALDLVKGSQFDLVFMDLEMPEMDGRLATQRIRSEVPVENQPFIVTLSASALKEEREMSSWVGANMHLPKPIDIGVLEICINKVARLCLGQERILDAV